MPSPTTPRPVAGLSYEQARDELVSVVQRLEAGGETLEASLELWERGEALAARCQEWLDGARERLDATRTGTAAAPGGSGTGGGATPDGDDSDSDSDSDSDHSDDEDLR
ncbi:exodeoxyribonuclease VII small subunit [Actinotalea solisilvae]|uniref:exodeoxyribonuclease VII small subunit n=1 Tax=Actinotalea solisilvae TaxID=2072922 RepID=UPI0027DDC1F1|nr:exodeoxyribonuclease VII small subunit [Actinotalea solisilvae]